jgi:hypothetical protein
MRITHSWDNSRALSLCCPTHSRDDELMQINGLSQLMAETVASAGQTETLVSIGSPKASAMMKWDSPHHDSASCIMRIKTKS